MENKLTPKKKRKMGHVINDFVEYTSINDLRNALVLVENYMTAVFPDLKWSVSKINSDFIDAGSSSGNETLITVLTNACSNMFATMEFVYDCKTKVLLPKCEDELLDVILIHTYKYTMGLEMEDKDGAFFAIYDECDREDGNPLYQIIRRTEIQSINTVSELLALAGSYEGDGYIDVRVRSENGKEETCIHMNNNGYTIISDFWM